MRQTLILISAVILVSGCVSQKKYKTQVAQYNELKANFDLTRASLFLAALYSTQHRPEAQAEWTRATGLIQDHGFEFLLEHESSLVLPWIAETLDSTDPVIARSTASLFQSLLHVPPAPITLQTLGGFSLQIGSTVISKENLRQRRAGELLVLLLTRPGYALSSDQVTECMCPEKDPKAALDFFHHATSALRRLLEPDLPDRRFPCRYLEVDEERVWLLLPAGSTIDIQEFETAVKQKNWQKAVNLYAGEFLPTLRYAEWTIPIRQHLSDQYESGLLTLAETKLKQNDPASCLDLSRQTLLHNPWQERAVELGMRAAIQLGDRTAALQMYQRLEKVLAKELGIAPQKELQQLYVAVKKRSL